MTVMGLRFKITAGGMYTAIRTVPPVLRHSGQEQEWKGVR